MEKNEAQRLTGKVFKGLRHMWEGNCANSVTCKPCTLVILAFCTSFIVAQPSNSQAQESTNTQESGAQQSGATTNSAQTEEADQELDATALLGAPPEPANLLGLEPADVRGLFGDPLRIDDVPPALSWHFVEADCVLDLIFYEAVTTRKLRVLSYDVTSTNEADDADASCLQQLLTSNG